MRRAFTTLDREIIASGRNLPPTRTEKISGTLTALLFLVVPFVPAVSSF